MPPRIRTIALCVFLNDGDILVQESHDPVSGLTFCRPLGGGIEFGETGAQAVAREIREEIGADVCDLRYLGTVENLFTYLGKPGHEIVLVYDGRLSDAACYERPSVTGAESDGQPFVASWRPLSTFGPERPLFPAGLLTLLQSRIQAPGDSRQASAALTPQRETQNCE